MLTVHQSDQEFKKPTITRYCTSEKCIKEAYEGYAKSTIVSNKTTKFIPKELPRGEMFCPNCGYLTIPQPREINSHKED